MPKLYKLTYTYKYQAWDIVEAESKAAAKRTIDKEDWQGLDYLTSMGEFIYKEGENWVNKEPVFTVEEITHDDYVRLLENQMLNEVAGTESQRKAHTTKSIKEE